MMDEYYKWGGIGSTKVHVPLDDHLVPWSITKDLYMVVITQQNETYEEALLFLISILGSELSQKLLEGNEQLSLPELIYGNTKTHQDSNPGIIFPVEGDVNSYNVNGDIEVNDYHYQFIRSNTRKAGKELKKSQ